MFILSIPPLAYPIPFIIWGTRWGHQLGNSSASWPGIKRAKNRTKKKHILSSKRWFASFWNLMFHEALSKIFYDIFLFQSDIPCTNWATCRSLKPLLGRLRLRWPTVQPRSMKKNLGFLWCPSPGWKTWIFLFPMVPALVISSKRQKLLAKYMQCKNWKVHEHYIDLYRSFILNHKRPNQTLCRAAETNNLSLGDRSTETHKTVVDFVHR